ncbi:hypothetical protein GCM10011529_20880 [Polymorphobacter glacialis]|uniref:Uncharacterized protein n=1 Tax=Sandarakinorhabdus glacialis TaxID=1614636 RepID=A0A916ZU54_9SPHN|nr:hypothetical protein GCM10011529_20880 [Polymorphobacter glacialis]
MAGEIVGIEAEGLGHARCEGVGGAGGGGGPGFDGGTELGDGGGPEVGAVEGPVCGDAAVFGAEFLAEVEAFLAVGGAGGEFAVEGEPAAPGAAAEGHGDAGFFGGRQGEEGAGGGFQGGEGGGSDAVAGDVEEAVVAAGGVDGAGDLGAGCGVGTE